MTPKGYDMTPSWVPYDTYGVRYDTSHFAFYYQTSAVRKVAGYHMTPSWVPYDTYGVQSGANSTSSSLPIVSNKRRV